MLLHTHQYLSSHRSPLLLSLCKFVQKEFNVSAAAAESHSWLSHRKCLGSLGRNLTHAYQLFHFIKHSWLSHLKCLGSLGTSHIDLPDT